jgi:hypothetical protein
VFLHPGCVNGKPWHHPDYDPIWRACEELNVPICFHGGGQNFLRPDYTLEVFDNLMMWHTFGQPIGIMAVIVSFASGGVINGSRICAPDCSRICGWAPAVPPSMSTGVDRPDRRARPREGTVGVLPLELLPGVEADSGCEVLHRRLR